MITSFFSLWYLCICLDVRVLPHLYYAYYIYVVACLKISWTIERWAHRRSMITTRCLASEDIFNCCCFFSANSREISCFFFYYLERLKCFVDFTYFLEMLYTLYSTLLCHQIYCIFGQFSSISSRLSQSSELLKIYVFCLFRIIHQRITKWKQNLPLELYPQIQTT